MLDRSVPYGEVMAVMNRIAQRSYLKIGLVGLEEEGGPPARCGWATLATSPPAAALQDAPEWSFCLTPPKYGAGF